MYQKLLLTLFIASTTLGAIAQKKEKRTTAYAITGVEKDSRRWTEVRLVDVYSGEVLQTIYESANETPVLNARTGKPIEKKADETRVTTNDNSRVYRYKGTGDNEVVIIRTENNEQLTITSGAEGKNKSIIRKTIYVRNGGMQKDKPFSTKSAACAFDRKHNRLYYTPLGINQLRYIDVKSKETKVFYFDEEAFGIVEGLHNVRNQITRMAIASDGDGYALTNNAEHLLKFTTNKKAVITDLGALQDDAANGENSIKSSRMYGGDLIADDKENLYLITANHVVFKISTKDLTAKFVGKISGLPRGYSTNGAVVDKETTVILSSANSSLGYYKFDMKSLEAEKISEVESVYSASDLANANFLTEKKKKNEQPEEVKQETENGNAAKVTPDLIVRHKISVYPNPVAKGEAVYVRFNDLPAGRYTVQLLDLGGKLISSESINVGGKMQLHLLPLPKTLSQGNYLVKVVGDANSDKVLATERVVVQ